MRDVIKPQTVEAFGFSFESIKTLNGLFVLNLKEFVHVLIY